MRPVLILALLLAGSLAARTTEELAPVVDYVARPPVIDGILDADLAALPPRPFSLVVKSDPANADVTTHFRLAYGADYFYLYVEAAAESAVCRDRAYQNGDGFQLVLAVPTADGSPSEQFHVVACSAVDDPALEWSRRFFWYHNVTQLFLHPSRDAELAYQVADGRLGFELLLPWADVRPHHPWLSGGIGFNLNFVKAVGDGKTEHLVLADPRIQSENSPRRYVRLGFAAPVAGPAPCTFVRLAANHVTAGDTLAGTVVTVAPTHAREQVSLEIRSGEDTRLGGRRVEFATAEAPTRHDFALPLVPDLPPGGYRLAWSSRLGEGRGEIPFTILPPLVDDEVRARLAAVRPRLAPSSATSLELMIEETAAQLTAILPYETCAPPRLAIGRIDDLLAAAARGDDVLARRTGLVRKAYRSRLDGTLQPYMVRVPEDYDPSRRYSLLVYLHGSGADETNLEGAGYLVPDGFLALAPRGRGTSNVYCADHAQDDIAEAVAAVLGSYSVDPSRVVLAGFSMGGYGVYRTHWETPGRYRALVVIAGSADLADRWLGEGYPNFHRREFLKPFAGVPIFVYHGREDLNVPFADTERLVDELRAAGAEVTVRFEAGRGHDAPGEAVQREIRTWLQETVAADR